MPLDDDYPLSAVFVLAWREVEGLRKRIAVGTGFVIGLAPPTDPNGLHLYVVTAGHLVATQTNTAIRLNRVDGTVVDHEVPEWFAHPTEDVAAAPLVPPPAVQIRFIDEKLFLDKWDRKPKLGDPVYFIGLLTGITEMAEANVPMVRGGTLGRMYQQRVPIKNPDGSIRHTKAHLIDCRSYGGFSGSPCFVQSWVTRWVDTPSIPGGAIGNIRFEETVLLGLVVAHFDQWEEARVTGDILGKIESPVNTGVGVVVPVEAIRQVVEENEERSRTVEN